MPGSERGASVTTFVAVVLVALFAVTGLVIDGGRQAHAVRRAQATAAAAARAATDAAVTVRLAGGGGEAAATAAAQRHLQAAGFAGTVTVLPDGRVRVDAHGEVGTVFLSLIGIATLPAEGSATSEAFPVR